jgi:Fe2+ or Zn2+ uptake regulation protein
VPNTPDPPALLRERGMRVTRPRLAVLRALQEAPHTDVHHLVGAVRGDIGAVSVQAVYDVLRALADAGLVRRVEPAGSAALFELRVGDNHHHIVCRRCGSTTDVDCAVGSAPCLDPSQAHGFLVDEAEVTFWGVCPACRNGDTSLDDERTGHPDHRSTTQGPPTDYLTKERHD